ncbi:MAG: helix-turn-helix domain-containing protein [Bacteroidia bacterium]
MDLNALKRLVRQGEGIQLEFKRKARHPDKIAREVIAFANTEGGVLLVGVDDDQTIYGCKYPQEDAFALKKFFDEELSPPIDYNLEYIPTSGSKAVLVFHIKPGDRKPYFLKPQAEGDSKGVFVRVADMSIRASREMVQILRREQGSKGVNLRFGEREKALLQYFEQEANITLAKAQNLLKTNRRNTSQLMILLVSAGLLRILPSEKGDSYSLAEESFK